MWAPKACTVRWTYTFLRHLSFEWDSDYLVSSQTNVFYPRVGCAIKGSVRTSMNNCRCIIASYYSKVFRYVGFLRLCNMVSPTTIPHFLGYCAFSLLISLTFCTVSEHLNRFWIWDPPLTLCFIMFPLGKQMQADGKNKSMAAPLPQPLFRRGVANRARLGDARHSARQLVGTHRGPRLYAHLLRALVFFYGFFSHWIGFVGNILPRKNMVFVHQIDWEFPGKMFPSINPMRRITIGWDEFICVYSHTK